MQVIDVSKNAGGRNSPLLEECKLIIRELRTKNQQQGNEVCSIGEVDEKYLLMIFIFLVDTAQGRPAGSAVLRQVDA